MRWFTLTVLAFATYVAFAIAAGSREKIAPREIKNIPALKVSSAANELIALGDPTLFALPHQHDFSILAWSKMPQTEQPSFRWSEPPRYLPLAEDQLGIMLHNFLLTNLVSGIQLEFKPSPVFSKPAVNIQPAVSQNSSLQIMGELARRKLVSPLVVPTLPHEDIIASTKIQVLVDAGGMVVSIVPLESSGWDVADERALELSRNAKFAPASGVTVGQLIFNWHTIPASNTNSTAESQ